MADIDTSTWSETAASNNAAPADGWPEGQSYASVNNCAREMMGALKREWNRSHPTLASAGTSTALTLTYTAAPVAYVQGLKFSFRLNQDCGAAVTLNVNALGAKTIKRMGPSGLVALIANDLRSGQIATVVYDSSADAMLLTSQNGRVGWQLLQTQTQGANTGNVFALTAGYNRYRLIATALNRSAGNGTQMGLQHSTDGGGSYVASFAVSGSFASVTNSGNTLTVTGTGQTTAFVFNDFNNSNNVNLEVDIATASADFRTYAHSSGAKYNGGAPYFCQQAIASIGAGTADHIRLIWSDGGSFTAQGQMSLYGWNEGT